MKPRLLTPEPTESEIQHAAYLLWLEEGRPAGRDLDIWLAAKERLRCTLPPHHGRKVSRARNAGHRPREAQAVSAGVR